MSDLTTIAHLLAAASHASDRSMRLAYLAEARARVASETERLRELVVLLETLEGRVATQLSLEASR